MNFTGADSNKTTGAGDRAMLGSNPSTAPGKGTESAPGLSVFDCVGAWIGGTILYASAGWHPVTAAVLSALLLFLFFNVPSRKAKNPPEGQ